MSRKRRVSSSTKSPVTETRGDIPTLSASGLFPLLAAALWAVRFWVPAEASAQGETLWIVACWLAFSMVATYLMWRSGSSFRRLDRLDLAVGGLVLAHVISALAVIGTQGQKRAALNLLWEWVGTGVAWLWLRGYSTQHRQKLTMLLLSACLVLSGLGIWQRFVWYPGMVQKINEWDRLSVAPLEETQQQYYQRQQKLRQLGEEFGPDWTQTDEQGRLQLRQRVQNSNEPLGRFALTNSFAGILAVGFVLSLSHHFKSSSLVFILHPSSFILPLSSFILLFCLVLTKSRTAWVGTACGCGLWYLLEQRRWSWKLILGGLLLGGVGLAGALGTKLIDLEVLKEAPKSFKYRLEYWRATLPLCLEHPWLGVGPGNFRQAYLHYKLPGSSEEVTDPHNFVLDIAANSGILGLIGVASLLVLAFQQLWRLSRFGDRGTGRGDREPAASGVPLTGSCVPSRSEGRLWTIFSGLSSLALIIGWRQLFEFQWDVQASLLALAWFPAVWSLTRGASTFEVSPAAYFGAWTALTIHLLGAGGIAMPIVTQSWLLLLGLVASGGRRVAGEEQAKSFSSESASPSQPHHPSPTTHHPSLVPLLLSIVLLFLCLWSTLMPVLETQTHLNQGDDAQLSGRGPAVAERRYREATLDDPYDPEPWRKLAQLHQALWSQGEAQQFETAVTDLQQAILRDPENPTPYSLLGKLYFTHFEETDSPASAHAATTALQQAQQRYPNSASINAALALALSADQQPALAQTTAKQALHLDGLNHAANHSDKYLAPKIVEKLEELL